MKGHVFFQGEIITKYSENTLLTFKNLDRQIRWADFNQSWHNASLGKGNQVSSNGGPRPFSRVDYRGNTFKKFKNLLFQNN